MVETSRLIDEGNNVLREQNTILWEQNSILRNMLHEQQKFTAGLISEIRDFKVQLVECFKKRALETDDEIDGKRRKLI